MNKDQLIEFLNKEQKWSKLGADGLKAVLPETPTQEEIAIHWAGQLEGYMSAMAVIMRKLEKL